ncbi:hypothetical protein EGT74_15795 [Chitinophaga lutea]|uniref:Uncharacterized protein n=1 Tax=Chitinophaga lutea TaxID=2488634 RepID=A0A3N4PWR8_9BACT|nr:hypothetical protein EGT74_15795 [Chitinophaga lutea]
MRVIFSRKYLLTGIEYGIKYTTYAADAASAGPAYIHSGHFAHRQLKTGGLSIRSNRAAGFS